MQFMVGKKKWAGGKGGLGPVIEGPWEKGHGTGKKK